MLDVVIIGAGFAGLYMLHRSRQLGLSARVFEAGADVGGTWYWNRYPGARCDVDSLQYSFSFSEEIEREWRWKERFAPQQEILAYLRFVADRLDLRRDIALESRVVGASFDEAAERWEIRTDRGDCVSSAFVVAATGCLSAARVPQFEGLPSFRGASYHTGSWPKSPVDFSGQRVGVIGTGSSGVQAIPIIAEQAAQLVVFQRTPAFSVPARNDAIPAETRRAWDENRAELRRQAREETRSGVLMEFGEGSALAVPEDVRVREYQRRWDKGGANFMYAYTDLLRSREANNTAADFIRAQIRATVRDPAVAEILTPKDYPVGAKRICVDTNYFETFNRQNVRLVDVRQSPITAITPGGLRTADGEYALDALVFATGFDAITGALEAIGFTGRSGLALNEKWSAGARTYLGLMTAGFPNLFMVTGPGSPSVLSNVVVSIEQHVEWIADCLGYMCGKGMTTIEATQAAEDFWVAHVNEVARPTLYPVANSWYMGANVPGKPRLFLPYVGGVDLYRKECARIAASGYSGFDLTARASAAA